MTLPKFCLYKQCCGGAWGWIESVQAWDGITIDNNDPLNPIVSTSNNLYTKDVTVWPSDILNIQSNPIELLPPPWVGLSYRLLTISRDYEFVTERYIPNSWQFDIRLNQWWFNLWQLITISTSNNLYTSSGRSIRSINYNVVNSTAWDLDNWWVYLQLWFSPPTQWDSIFYFTISYQLLTA